MDAVSPTLNPQMAEILRLIAGQDLPPYESMSGAEARAAAEERNRFWNEGNPEVGRVREATLPGPAGAMRLRLYEPEGVAPVSPAILYLHGGGWVICSLDTHDGVCRRLANAAGVRVASLDYRMAPEHPYPAPLEDCVAAARGIRSHGRELGIDPDRLALAGDSAGANLALAALLTLRDAGETLPRAAALIYGVVLGRSRFARRTALRRRRVCPLDCLHALVLGPVRAGPCPALRPARLASARRSRRAAATLRLRRRA